SQQFTNFIDELAFYENASTDLHYPPSFKQEQKFTTCPTVLLRAIVPSSGFTITFKAMLDSGAESSFISFDLARLLIKNGANWEYVWPKIGCYPFYELFTFHYRNICDLTLQSVENISVKMTTSIRVDECTPFFQDELPFILIVNKMVSLGLLMIQSNERRLNDTMFSENDPNSEYCIDMLIGQDLLNAHFNIHPIQPTYHITPSLVIIRTKMGLAFLGQFDIEKI
ncbi:hypothetical protein TYRP_003360, partial [Tyrophagus putrescentiae]